MQGPHAVRAAFVVGFGLCVGACSGSSNEPTPAQLTDGGGSDSGSHVLPRIPSCSPTTSSIRDDIVVPTCALPLCHIGSDSFFELVPFEPSKTLIGVPATCRDWILVVPGDPDRSYLWHKLTDDEPACGDRMPWGSERLPDNALECIRGWIQSLH